MGTPGGTGPVDPVPALSSDVQARLTNVGTHMSAVARAERDASDGRDRALLEAKEAVDRMILELPEDKKKRKLSDEGTADWDNTIHHKERLIGLYKAGDIDGFHKLQANPPTRSKYRKAVYENERSQRKTERTVIGAGGALVGAAAVFGGMALYDNYEHGSHDKPKDTPKNPSAKNKEQSGKTKFADNIPAVFQLGDGQLHRPDGLQYHSSEAVGAHKEMMTAIGEYKNEIGKDHKGDVVTGLADMQKAMSNPWLTAKLAPAHDAEAIKERTLVYAHACAAVLSYSVKDMHADEKMELLGEILDKVPGGIGSLKYKVGSHTFTLSKLAHYGDDAEIKPNPALSKLIDAKYPSVHKGKE